MGIAKALTNDLERGLRLYRIPILTALAISMRRFIEDRFLITDDRTEDERRNVVGLQKITRIEQQTCKPGIGADDRQFDSLTGNLLFVGIPDANGIINAIGNLSNVGGREDIEGVLWTASGTAQQKQDKAERYNKLRPSDVCWRVRTPVMMAPNTTIIDYLALRCTHLPFLHSIALKWSDRRWDARQVGLDQDLYRPENERSEMIILAPMWMDAGMSILDPTIWGPFESLIQSNYEEYLGRKWDEQLADCAAFVDTFEEYLQVLRPSGDAQPWEVNSAQVGRVQRLLDTTANRTLFIPFNRGVVGDGKGGDTYRIADVDPETSQDVTQDVFNLLDADGHWRLTSSFEAASFVEDGWCGTATPTQTTDIPENLPPFAYNRLGEAVYGTKSLEITGGFFAHRLVLPNGTYALKLRVKNVVGTGRVEIIRNNRLLPKGWAMDQATNRVTSIAHWRQNYETVASTIVRDDVLDEWREIWVSFDLIDHLQTPSEGYPAHEIYIVLSTVDSEAVPPPPVVPPSSGTPAVIRFDALELFSDNYGHALQILNTVNRSPQPFDVRPELCVVNLEKAFQEDSIFGDREQAAASFRLDGNNSVVMLDHRTGYNVKAAGTTIDTWFKVNSDDETENNVLAARGGFTLFQKDGAYLPGYACSVDQERLLFLSVGKQPVFGSKSFRNTMLHPSVLTDWMPPRTDWASPTIYQPFWDAFHETGLQPTEWTTTGDTSVAYVGYKTDIGGGKYLLVTADDPYVVAAGDPPYVFIKAYLLWHARRAYGMIMPADRVDPDVDNTETGFVFAPIPINPLLYQIEPFLGDYSPSPAEWSPRYYYSPDIYSPHGPPLPVSPALATEILWPISPNAWGSPFDWPASPSLYGTQPAWNLFAWGAELAPMLTRYPIFINGALKFDRWVHLDAAMAQGDAEIGINGITVFVGGVTIPDGTDLNYDNLLLGAVTPDATNVAAPISLYAFKIFQRRLSAADRNAIFCGEAVNFNELQYNVYKDALDYDGDGVLDFWQSDINDLGLWTKLADPGPRHSQALPR